MIHHITWADHRMSKSAELAMESAKRFGCEVMDVTFAPWFQERHGQYTDAGVEIINSPRYLVDAMDGDIMLFGNHYQHRDWCKREVFDLLDCKDGFQVQASAILIRCSAESNYFIDEWMVHCQIRDFINDKSWMIQYPSFQEHRHDQAILTAVAQKYNLPLHWWPAVYNDGAFTYDKGTYTDTYPPIFHHHRKRNDEW